MYIDLYHEFRTEHNNEKVNINDDLVFEMELIKQVEINIDYIVDLVKKYHANNIKDKDVLADINRAIESSVELRNKKNLIEQFIESLDISSPVDDDWITFVEQKKQEELEKIIQEEKLNSEETYKFIKNAFRNGEIPTTGIAITKILPPVSRFNPDGQRTQKRETVLEKLIKFFERFFDISSK
jgi:type I restriction enzyme R subunit